MPRPRHVLIVDDEEQMRLVLARLLKRTWTDVTIAEAAHGAEALSAVTQQRPDLIITDYQMPVMGGLELIRTLRTQGATCPSCCSLRTPAVPRPSAPPARPPFCPSRFVSLRSRSCCARCCPMARKRARLARYDSATTTRSMQHYDRAVAHE